MSPLVNIETIHNKSIDARITATCEFHIKAGEVVQVNVIVKDGVLTPANSNAIREFLEFERLPEFLDG